MKNKKIFIAIIAVIVAATATSSYFLLRSPWKFREDRPIRIFYLNSFHPINTFTLEHIRGFEDVFKEEGIDYEIEGFNMDSIRRSSEEQKKEAGLQAKERIDNYQPDLIFATDDTAQGYVIQPYLLNIDIPVVFASVEGDISTFGYIGSKNVAGVIAIEHIASGIALFRGIYPEVRRVAVISEPDKQWILPLDRLKNQDAFPDMEFIGFHTITYFEELQERVLYYQDKVDAFFFTPLSRILYKDGTTVSRATTNQWVVEHSTLPEFTLWTGVNFGMSVAVIVSQYEQGKAAGRIAQEILIEGKAPSQFEFKPTPRGDQYINLARLKTLGLEQKDIRSTLLINSKIIEKFPWDE